MTAVKFFCTSDSQEGENVSEEEVFFTKTLNEKKKTNKMREQPLVR